MKILKKMGAWQFHFWESIPQGTWSHPQVFMSFGSTIYLASQLRNVSSILDFSVSLSASIP